MKLNVVAYSLGGEIGDGLRQIEGGGSGWTGAGASGDENGCKSCEGGREEMGGAGVGIVAGGHSSQASILRRLGGAKGDFEINCKR